MIVAYKNTKLQNKCGYEFRNKTIIPVSKSVFSFSSIQRSLSISLHWCRLIEIENRVSGNINESRQITITVNNFYEIG